MGFLLKVGDFVYLPDCIISTSFMNIEEKLCALAHRPECARKLEKYFGISSNIELGN